MDHDDRTPLHTRLRWGNLARAGAVVALAATIIAWPRLTPREPALPPVDPVPVAPATVARGADPAGEDAAQGPAAVREQERQAARRRSAARAREREAARERSAARERTRRAARRRAALRARERRRSPRTTGLEAAGPGLRRDAAPPPGASPPPAVPAPARAAPAPARAAPAPEFRPGGGDAPGFSLG